MDESLSGGTSNLLRMARSGCQSAVAFVALALGDQSFATAMYPSEAQGESLGAEAMDQLVRQLWTDPGLGQGKALVRTVRLASRRLAGPSTRLAVAAVPLGLDPEGRPWGILGVADPETKSFGMPELELLSRIAQRLASYVRARQEIRQQIAFTAATARPADTPAGPTGEATTSAPAGAGAAGAAAAETGASAAEQAETWWTVQPGPAAVPAEPQFPASRPVGRPSAPPPPFPPPAGTVGPPPAGTGAPPQPEPAAPTGVSARADAGQEPAAPPEPGAALPGSPDVAPILEVEPASTGLLPLGTLLARAGRLLGAGAETSGTLAMVALQVAGSGEPVGDVLAAVAEALRAELRFDDPVSRIGPAAVVAVVPLVAGGSSAEDVAQRLTDAVERALAGREADVRSSHVAAELKERHDADELLRSVVRKLRAV